MKEQILDFTATGEIQISEKNKIQLVDINGNDIPKIKKYRTIKRKEESWINYWFGIAFIFLLTIASPTLKDGLKIIEMYDTFIFFTIMFFVFWLLSVSSKITKLFK